MSKLLGYHLVSIPKTWIILDNEGLYLNNLRKVQALLSGNNKGGLSFVVGLPDQVYTLH